MQPHIKGNLKFHSDHTLNDKFIIIQFRKAKTTDNKNFRMSQFIITVVFYLQSIASFLFTLQFLTSENVLVVGIWSFVQLVFTIWAILQVFNSFWNICSSLGWKGRNNTKLRQIGCYESNTGSGSFKKDYKTCPTTTLPKLRIRSFADFAESCRLLIAGSFNPSTKQIMPVNKYSSHTYSRFLNPNFFPIWILGNKIPFLNFLVFAKYIFKKISSLFWTLKSEIKKFKPFPRDIHTECSKQFKWNLYFDVSGQIRPFWAALKLLWNLNIIF